MPSFVALEDRINKCIEVFHNEHDHSPNELKNVSIENLSRNFII